jgi:hypothetical protein
MSNIHSSDKVLGLTVGGSLRAARYRVPRCQFVDDGYRQVKATMAGTTPMGMMHSGSLPPSGTRHHQSEELRSGAIDGKAASIGRHFACSDRPIQFGQYRLSHSLRIPDWHDGVLVIVT